MPYEALEDAGCPPHVHNEDIGIFGGTRTSGYSKILRTVLQEAGSSRSFDAILGTAVDQLCLRVSHALNLRGPSIGIQTACSASIVATHFACESLRSGECSMALAGASAIYIPQKRGYLFDAEMISSPDGHCRAFDANALGTTSGEGVGIVVLKRLSDAIKNHDRIYAIIKGSTVNNDGAAKAGYRVPSVEGQTRSIAEALMISGVDASTIGYVEANGTGTLFGDSIEVEGLTRVFRITTDQKHFCGIGSVKTNIGHLTQAAGIAGLIKTVLSLNYKTLYPSLNCKTPNPSLTDSPFYVVQETSEWKSDQKPRRAGVNSFAIGGTNAHLILEEAPLPTNEHLLQQESASHIFTISTKQQDQLKVMIQKYKAYLMSDSDASIGDICFTSNVGRYHYPWRFSVVTQSKQDLLQQLNHWLENTETKPTAKKLSPRVLFLFSQGRHTDSQEMQSFYKTQPSFKNAVAQCYDLLNTMEGKIPDSLTVQNFYPGWDTALHSFITGYALSAMWKSWGIDPLIATGEGIGALCATCVSGDATLEQSLGQAVADTTHSSPAPATSTSEFYPEDTEDAIDIIVLFGLDTSLLDRYPTLGISTIVQVSSGSEDEWRGVLCCLKELYVRGKDIDWNEVAVGQPWYKTSLPTYPFDRKSCWFNG